MLELMGSSVLIPESVEKTQVKILDDTIPIIIFSFTANGDVDQRNLYENIKVALDNLESEIFKDSKRKVCCKFFLSFNLETQMEVF